MKRKLFSISGKIALDLAHLIIFLQLLSPFCEIQVVLHDCFFFLLRVFSPRSILFQILTSVKKEHTTAFPTLNVLTPMDLLFVKVIPKTPFV